jgi:threonine aldolase
MRLVDDETRARRASCTRFLAGDGLVSARTLLASIDPDVAVDSYGDGGVVAELEAHVAQLLAKPAAVLLPSGTMAQAATLRVHADARARRTVAWHPMCHLEQRELQAHAQLHGLIGRPVGSVERLITLADLEEVAQPLAALLIELPQRDLGGQLPEWTQLQEQLAWARDRGAATHLDGARLWEAAAGYERSPAQIAALFDTVYVSFYKGIGALPGCCVAGPDDVIAQVREWRRRLGGTLYGMWPAAASALRLLPERLAEMPARLVHARAIAAALTSVPGIRVVPDPPQTPMMHLLLTVSARRYEENAKRLAEQDRTWVWPEAEPAFDPDVVRCDLSVGRATCALAVEEVVAILRQLIA